MSHVTLAASAKAFGLMFQLVRDNLKLPNTDSGNFGPFTASYSVAVHLEKGTIQLNADDTVEIKNLDVVWDSLDVKLCFNLPGYCIGGWCIGIDPVEVCVPKVCVGGPLCLDLDLSGIVSKVHDVKAHLKPKYYVDPSRPVGVSDLTAEFAGKSNKWQVFLIPVKVDVDLIDVPATIANQLETKFKQAIQDTYPGVPGWAWPLIWRLLGPLLDLLKLLLHITEEIENWVATKLLDEYLGLTKPQGWLATAIADYFGNKYPLFDFEDPYPILDGAPSHNPIPVKIPLRNLASHVNAKEMVVTADVGA